MREAELYAKLPVFSRRVEQAKQIIADGLKQCVAPYLACSFGKDSAAMLHLVLEQMPQIRVRFMRWEFESDLLHDYEKVIGEWQNRFNLNLEIVEMRRDSIDDQVKTRWQELEKEADGYYVGLRADEHKNRLATLKFHGTIYKKKNGLTRICPLAWWKTIDVQTYIETNNLPTLSAYQSEGFNTRTTARVPRQDVRARALGQLKQRDLISFNMLKKHFPELAEYV